MMVILVLLILTAFLYGILFSNFGFLPGIGRGKREKAAKNLSKKTPTTGGGWPCGAVEKDNREPIWGGICGQNCEGHRVDAVTDKVNAAEKGKIRFDEILFLKLSEALIVAVAEAFSEKRFDLLRNMLTDDLFRAVEEKINSREGHVSYKTVVVSFDEKVLEEKQADEYIRTNMVVNMRVLMNQINYMEDQNNNIVYGSKNAIEKVSEIWKFVLDTEGKSQGRWLVKSIGRC
ncbi:MAG: TIM44-like domain-containing protein [Rickettsiales bacterium]|jgi:predicted lipid-binding transport protein (Tim44 family)|nr:TIM44-like domain-containing protein [Rickettsiales bacterium]